VSVTEIFCEYAWLGESKPDVSIEVADERIVKVTDGAAPGPDAIRLSGLTIPGLANAHSHAFHRALRGRATGPGSFWTWQQEMYRVAERLDPERYYELALATYCEMAMAGIVAVGEFHYLHHGPGGAAYRDPNEMSLALIEAARDAGIRITLLDTLYLRGGFDADLSPFQIRFSDGSVEQWAARVEALPPAEDLEVGAAIHSVRAVSPEAAAAASAWTRERGAPLHFHLSEQPAENEACMAATGMTPTEVLDEAGALGPLSTAIHATHLTDGDIGRLGGSKTSVCFCPTTERDLGDGVGPAIALTGAGAPLALGTDSHAIIDMFDEMRLLELHERLVSLERGHHAPTALIDAASTGGMRSLGRKGGHIAVGLPADLVAIDLGSVRTAGIEDPAAAVVYAATNADVTDVIVGGEAVVRDRRHQLIDDVPARLAAAVEALQDPSV
jgi:formiminoglutamate deiminase